MIATAPRARGDEGSAIVEFVVLGVLMLLPIVYLVMALGRLQAGALAVEQAAREAGRAYVTAPDAPSGEARARTAADLAYADQGFGPPHAGQLVIDCAGDSCLAANSRVDVHAALTVTLPGVPAFFARLIPVAVTVRASHVSSVDEFRARRR